MRLIGVDYGTRYIGIAISDDARIIASPLTTITNTSHAVADTLAIVEQEQAAGIVVGVPIPMKGQESILLKEIQLFVEDLRAEGSVPVIIANEVFSTQRARQRLRQSRSSIDEHAAAAAEILQAVLDRNGK